MKHNVALLIGVDYPKGHGRYPYLPEFRCNIEAFEEVLVEGGYDQKNIFCLGKDGNELSTREKIFEFFDKCRLLFENPEYKNGLLLIYFSGHGDKVNTGFCDEEEFSFMVSGSITATKVDNMFCGEFKAKVDQINAPNKIIIVDCCYSGAVIEFYKSQTGELSEGLVVFASCDTGQKAHTSKFGTNLSLFTYHLLNLLKGEHDNERDEIDTAALYSIISVISMDAKIKDQTCRQDPVLGGSFNPKNLSLLNKKYYTEYERIKDDNADLKKYRLYCDAVEFLDELYNQNDNNGGKI